jgi:hypothetical protein
MRPSKMENSPPSIPYGDFKYGYKESGDGYHLVSLKNQKDTSKYNIEGKSTLGPGTYQVNDRLIKRNYNKVISYD